MLATNLKDGDCLGVFCKTRRVLAGMSRDLIEAAILVRDGDREDLVYHDVSPRNHSTLFAYSMSKMCRHPRDFVLAKWLLLTSNERITEALQNVGV